MAVARQPDGSTRPKSTYSDSQSRLAGMGDVGQATSLFEELQLDGSLLNEQNDSIFESVLPKVKLPRWDWVINKTLKQDKTLGEGRYGSVHLVYDSKNKDFKMAFKQIKGANRKCKKLFAKELLLLDDLKHSNVPQIYAFSVNPIGLFQEYMAFEWNTFGVERTSHDLEHFMKTLCDLKGYAKYNEKASLARNIALDVARGLDYLHGRGIAHRDLKLQNILVSNKHVQQGQLLICKITDFGEARATHIQTNTVARTGTIHIDRGTMLYQAPEVILKEDDAVFVTLDLKRIDVWAFGVVLLFVLNPDLEHIFAKNMEQPSQPGHLQAFMAKMMQSETKPSSSDEFIYLRKLFPDVDRVRSMCLAYDPQKRPSARKIVIELEGGTNFEAGEGNRDIPEPWQLRGNSSRQGSVRESDQADEFDRAGTFHPTYATEEHTGAGQGMDSIDAVGEPSGRQLLNPFQRIVAVHGPLITKLMDPDEVVDILYAKALFSRKDKEKADECRYGSIHKSEVVLSTLQELPRDRLEVALKVLSKNNHKGLVDLLTEEKVPSEPFHWCVIRKNLKAMMDSLDPGTILISYLVQNGVLNDRDKDHVDKCTTTADKIGMILDILRRKSENDFMIFLECLNISNQEHVADILRADCDI